MADYLNILQEDFLREFGTANAALEFWNDAKEDIYQDYLNFPENNLHTSLTTQRIQSHDADNLPAIK
jgi:hypothetical protein